MTSQSSGPIELLAAAQPRHLALVAVAALGYAVATIGMKLASASLSLVAVTVVVTGLSAAVLAEISLLRKADLGIIYITVIGGETLLVLAFAAAIGEGLDVRRIAGAGMVLGGIALVSH